MSIRDTTAWVGLGANLGDRKGAICSAIKLINDLPNTRVVAESRLYRTKAVGPLDDPEYLNGAIGIQSTLSSPILLASFNSIEQQIGRVERERWHAREIDIDLLLRGKEIVETELLTLPHPELIRRRFVLVPLVDIAPNVIEPKTGQTIRALLNDLPVFENDVVPLRKEKKCDT